MSHLPGINKTFPSVTLTPEESRRYERHLILPEVSVEGQRKLKAARVVVIGAGGLGSPALAYLAAAGVGTIGVVDFDTVDESNLQRQIVHKTRNVGKAKTASAAETIAEINPLTTVELHNAAFRADNALEILRNYDLVVDGSDNFPARYLVNDACVLLDKPNVYGSIFRFEGRASVFWASRGPCYRCLHPLPPPPGEVPSCAEAGVLGVLPGVIGSIQAIEAVKLIIGQGESLIGRLLIFDALKMRFREVHLRKDPACPVCGTNPTIRELVQITQTCSIKPAGSMPAVPEISVSDLKAAMDRGDQFDLIDVREPHEHASGSIPSARLIPVGELAQRAPILDAQRPVYLHCQGGGRSSKACALLQSLGFTDVRSVAGGYKAWQREIGNPAATP
jgi:sulfur-carrier protein adenylyltransferase/sulfurtransferase